MFIIELLVNFIYFILALMLPGKIKKLDIEVTRKISHILCGNWIFMFTFLNNHFLTNIIIIVIMLFLMSLSYKYNIFKGVERKEQVRSYGTIYFFISLLILVIMVEKYQINKSIIIIYFFPLVYGDAMAAIIGRKFNWLEYRVFGNKKTISGSAGMFLVSFISIFLYNFFILNNYYSVKFLMLEAVIAAIIEAISIKGIDNLTIPIVTMFICEVII